MEFSDFSPDEAEEAFLKAFANLNPNHLVVSKERVGSTMLFDIRRKDGEAVARYRVRSIPGGGVNIDRFSYSSDADLESEIYRLIKYELEKIPLHPLTNLATIDIDTSSLQNRVVRLKEMSSQFIRAAYIRANGSTEAMQRFRTILEALGWDERLLDRIEAYLTSQRLIRRMTLGGIDGQFVLTHSAVRMVEREILFDQADLGPRITQDMRGIVRGTEEECKYPLWFPKMDQTRRKWGQAWSIIESMCTEYYTDDAYADDEPEPGYEDYRDALAYRMEWKPKQRTIGNIRRAGRQGWLDEYKP